MELTSEQIQLLLVEKIAGTIAPEDDMIIEQLIAENAFIRHQWQGMQQEVQQLKDRGFSIEGNAEQRWQQLKPLLKKRSKVRVLSFGQIVIAAAMLIAIVTGIFLVIKKQAPASTVTYTPASKLGEEKLKTVTLLMDNGSTISLNNTESKVFQIGGAIIQANAKKLSFTTAKSEIQQWSTLAVPAALDYKIKLADGTEVWLNAKTKLRFPFNFLGNTREVYMDGEAYFKVAKNKQQPFIVHTPQTDIVVTGTEFNVNAYEADKTETSLVEGAVVAKSPGSKPVGIKPGFEAVFTPQQGFSIETFDESEVLSWMKGVYYFHNTSLQDLSKVLSRWYDVEVHFENIALMHKTFSGELVKHQSLQWFLDNLKISAEVSSYIKNGVVYFN